MFSEETYEQAHTYFTNGQYARAFFLFESLEQAVRLNKPQIVPPPLKGGR